MIIDKKSKWYVNCKRQRKNGAKICQDCPFKNMIEETENDKNNIPDLLSGRKFTIRTF